jgi:hypothetical protein
VADFLDAADEDLGDHPGGGARRDERPHGAPARPPRRLGLVPTAEQVLVGPEREEQGGGVDGEEYRRDDERERNREVLPVRQPREVEEDRREQEREDGERERAELAFRGQREKMTLCPGLITRARPRTSRRPPMIDPEIDACTISTSPGAARGP